MPVRAPRVCGNCGSAHSKGERCPVAAARHAERKAVADAKRPGARLRGYDREWEKLRADFLAANPSCRCGARASLVDHKTPIRAAPHRRLDPTNLQSLCTPCHSGAKQSQDRRNLKGK